MRIFVISRSRGALELENCGTLLIETTSESITAKVMAILFNVL